VIGTLRIALGLALAAVAACGPRGPEPIVLHEDACAYCRMTIADSRFGGEAITRTGRIVKFDSVECLAAWVRAAQPGTVRSVFVIDLQHPGTFVRADAAGFLEGAMIASPMGRALVAFATPGAAEAQRAVLGGRVRTWAEVLATTPGVSGE
jgi:copper chaperone NosL